MGRLLTRPERPCARRLGPALSLLVALGCGGSSPTEPGAATDAGGASDGAAIADAAAAGTTDGRVAEDAAAAPSDGGASDGARDAASNTFSVTIDGTPFTYGSLTAVRAVPGVFNIFTVTATKSDTELVRVKLTVPSAVTSLASAGCTLDPKGTLELTLGTTDGSYRAPSVNPVCASSWTMIPSTGTGRLVGTFSGTLTRAGGGSVTLANGAIDVLVK